MKIGILGTADIAFRRFLPALQKCDGFEYAGVASRTPQKAESFVENFGGKIYDGYDAMLEDDRIDAVYLPLPPALHYEWGKKVLLSGKHLLMEKPFTISLAQTNELLRLAEEKGLAVYENYMFLYHAQLAYIKKLIADGELGDIRLYRLAFGFPKRAADDFRYNKKLGGGALLDCGGYTVRLAMELLGSTAHVTQANLVCPDGYEVDLYGSAVLENNDGICAQLSFGMDNAYRCQLEVWGSRANLIADRIFTASAGVVPPVVLMKQEKQNIELPADDAFHNSLCEFKKCIEDKEIRNKKSAWIFKQAEMIELLKNM